MPNADEHPRKTRFASRAGPNNAEKLASANRERNSSKYRRFAPRGGGHNIFDEDRTEGARQRHAFRLHPYELQQSLHVQTLIVGLVKAPVFAFVIALVGCYEGFQVERNAASVGLLTTRSVVESVFLVIVLDAAFSIMFSVLGI